jgi:hypothetical protein
MRSGWWVRPEQLAARGPAFANDPVNLYGVAKARTVVQSFGGWGLIRHAPR